MIKVTITTKKNKEVFKCYSIAEAECLACALRKMFNGRVTINK